MLCLDPAEVPQTLSRINPGKSAGPDQIPGCVLKECAEQLMHVLTDIFDISLRQAVLPSCYKASAIIPVPKKPTVTTLNDYRPVALTLIIMKCLERLVKGHITSILPPSLDPLQFAYCPNHSTEDAISPALHLALEHLENKSTLVQILFVDFSLAFNTIIPQHLINKLGPLGLNTHPQKLDTGLFNRQTLICTRRELETIVSHYYAEHRFSAGVCSQPPTLHPDDPCLLC